MANYQLGPVIGKIGGAETIDEPFSITGTQSLERMVEVADGEEWLVVAQITVTSANGVASYRLSVYLDGVEIENRMGMGDYFTGGLVTSTALLRISGDRTNDAHGRIFAVRVSD